MTRDEFVTAIELRCIAFPPSVVSDVLDLFRQREETILDQFRAVIAAKVDYLAALHAKAGSRYGADRYGRNLEFARERRDRAAKELGL